MAYYGYLSVRRTTWRILAEYFMALGYRLEAFTRTKSKTDSFSTTEKIKTLRGQAQSFYRLCASYDRGPPCACIIGLLSGYNRGSPRYSRPSQQRGIRDSPRFRHTGATSYGSPAAICSKTGKMVLGSKNSPTYSELDM